MRYKIATDEIHSYIFELPDDYDLDDVSIEWPVEYLVEEECHDLIIVAEYKCDLDNIEIKD